MPKSTLEGPSFQCGRPVMSPEIFFEDEEFDG